MKPRDIESGLTADRLREVVRYEPETGKFFWLQDKNQNMKAGDEAGSLENTGYIRITIDGKRRQAHRLVWLYMTGEWPTEQVDHENMNKSDNRWINLRPANNSQNRANSRPNNALGIKGVRRHHTGKYVARICKDQKSIYLGLFETVELAGAAYEIAAKEIFGEFARVA